VQPLAGVQGRGFGELVGGQLAPVGAHQQRQEALVVRREAGQVRVL
jgi:hypothetical protein